MKITTDLLSDAIFPDHNLGMSKTVQIEGEPDATFIVIAVNTEKSLEGVSDQDIMNSMVDISSFEDALETLDYDERSLGMNFCLVCQKGNETPFIVSRDFDTREEAEVCMKTAISATLSSKAKATLPESE